MPIMKSDAYKLDPVTMEGVVGALKANVIGPDQGWEDHTLRVFRIDPHGNTPKHQHDWIHVNYIMRGKGTLMIDGDTQEVKQGDFALVPANTDHQFTNPNDEPFEFICIVPNRGAY